MTRTTSSRPSRSSRFTAVIAGALISGGILAGSLALPQTRTHDLADYGAAITADDATDHARDRGVPHMDDHRHSAGYFEKMDGVGR